MPQLNATISKEVEEKLLLFAKCMDVKKGKLAAMILEKAASDNFPSLGEENDRKLFMGLYFESNKNRRSKLALKELLNRQTSNQPY